MKNKILSLNKGECFFIFSAVKDKNILENLLGFLKSVGMSPIKTNIILSPLGDSDNNYSLKSYSDEIYTDVYFHIEDKNNLIVFFGKDKVILSIFGKIDQEYFSKKIEDFFEFK